MLPDAGATLYVIGMVFAEALRLRHRLERLTGPRREEAAAPARPSERVVMAGVTLGIWFVPLLYIVTPWLGNFDYEVPAWAVWVAGMVFVSGLAVRWAAHRALGRQWSHTLEMKAGHHLVSDGVYGRVRHPIYVSLVLWAVSQPFLLPNAVAGLGGIVAALLMWFVRVPREERMMAGQFGDEYRDYMARTPRLIPRLRGQGRPRY